MSRVLVKGKVDRMKGPWQYDCQYCRSIVELTVDTKVVPDDSPAYWLCPGCGEDLYVYGHGR